MAKTPRCGDTCAAEQGAAKAGGALLVCQFCQGLAEEGLCFLVVDFLVGLQDERLEVQIGAVAGGPDTICQDYNES